MLGPETWWIHYPSASGGMQSPIDIETEETLLDAEYGRSPLEVNYHVQAAHGAEHGEGEEELGVDEIWTMVNTGATLRVNITNSQSCTSTRRCALAKRTRKRRDRGPRDSKDVHTLHYTRARTRAFLRGHRA